jgi:hypothetical protein
VEPVLSILWLIAVVWLLLRALRQRSALRSLRPAGFSGQAPSLAVIVPARDEAANIARCLPDAGRPAPEMPHRELSEHVRRASGRATTVVLVVIVLFLYGIRHVLLPIRVLATLYDEPLPYERPAGSDP